MTLDAHLTTSKSGSFDVTKAYMTFCVDAEPSTECRTNWQ